MYRDMFIIIYFTKLDPHMKLYIYTLRRMTMKLGTNSDDVMRTGHEHLSRMRLLYMHAFLST
jgi:hypothetical protein